MLEIDVSRARKETKLLSYSLISENERNHKYTPFETVDERKLPPV